MTQNYVSFKFLQFSFFISCITANANFNADTIFKSPRVNSVLKGGFSTFFKSVQTDVAGNLAHIFFKAKTSFVNYYLDFALSRGGGGGGGGGDDDWIINYFRLPIFPQGHKSLKEINTI